MHLLRNTILCCLVGNVLITVPAVSQQKDISRYDLYTGFSDLNTPGLNNINQVGFDLQTGVNLSTWSVLGLDYSVQHGSGVLTRPSPPLHGSASSLRNCLPATI
ncbi:MAG: hypothetical protein ACRYFU_11520 [Janthinobacterium lividum]